MSASDRVTPAELAAWTAANVRARNAYYFKPNAVTHAIYTAIDKGKCRECGKRLSGARTRCGRCSARAA